MKNDDTNHEALANRAIATTQAPVDIFGMVEALLLAVAEPKVSAQALAELKRQGDQIVADRTQLEVDRAAFAEHETATRAALAKQADANGEDAGQLYLRSLELKNQHATLAGIFRDISIKDEQLRRRLLRYTGREINEKLQSLPGWEELERLFGTADAPIDARETAAQRFLEGKVADLRGVKPKGQKGAHAHA
jgi:hypothetical protein